MLIKYIGVDIRGFYTVASFSTKEPHMRHTTKHKALVFWENHSINALTDRSHPHRVRRRTWPQVTRQRRRHPSLGPNKRSVLLKP